MRGEQKDAKKLQFRLRRKATTSKAAFAFPASARLKLRSDFLRVRECGRKAYSRHFMIVYAPSKGVARVGLAITKKVEASAVRRNRLKRLLREVFRLNRCRFASNVDVVVVARGDITALSYETVCKEFLEVCTREGLLRQERM